MYRITNVADKVLTDKYGTANLLPLSSDKLMQICADLKINPVFVRTGKGPAVLNKLATIKVIEQNFLLSEYMDDKYWDEEHVQLAVELGFANTLKNAVTGKDTFLAYEQVRFGFFDLAMGKSMELNVTDRWVEEVLKKKPFAKYLKIEKVGEVVEDTILNDIDNMSYKDLQELAKRQGINPMQKKDVLISVLKEDVANKTQ